MPSHAEPREDAYQRFRRLMPKTQDLTLIVLKGHLLLEEQLQHFLDDLSRKPQALSDARLTFFQRWRLMQAITGHSHSDNIVRFVDGASRLRNRLAHHAEVLELEQAVDGLLNTFYEDEFYPPVSKRQRATELRNAFALTVAMVSGFTSGFLIGLGEPWMSKVIQREKSVRA